jgi:hypothetical protein
MLPHFFHLISSDRYLTAVDVEQAAEVHPLTGSAWEVYDTHFHGFTGATIDPLFHRLAHPATRFGALRLDAGTAVVVVGNGPSLHTQIEALERLQGRVRIFTSPRGAETLLGYGLVPDLVVIEHQTALDAHHSARHLGDCAHPVLAACPLVAADWRTPAALLAGVRDGSLFVPSPLPTWGLWPATAVAMAIEAGAARVALLGIDLGTEGQPDPAHAPLAGVLGLLARISTIVALDCSVGGAPKRGWLKASVAEAAGLTVRGTCETTLHQAPSASDRLAVATLELRELAPLVDRARALLAMATAARAGRPADAPALEAGVTEMLSWRDDPRTRLLVQECLGASFVPRLWRIGVDLSLGPALWRPLMLGLHELVGQVDALSVRIATAPRLRSGHAA